MLNRTLKTAVCLTAFVMISGACQSTAEPIATPTATATPAATPTVFVESAPNPLEHDFKLYTDKPVVPMGEPPAWDSGLMDPGAVIFHDNKFHMFYDAVASYPARIEVGYAVSNDGITWTRVATQPVFTIVNIPWRPAPMNLRVNSAMVMDNTWVLYFSASDSYRDLIGIVGRATASSPTGPWTVDAEPVLKPGEEGEWDAGRVGNVEVIQTDKGFTMYYATKLGIGMATSPDGIQWTKYDDPATSEAPFADSDPVVDMPAPMGDLDPNVVYTGQDWQMVTRSEPGLVYGTSADGIHWTLADQKPIVSSTELQKVIWFSAFLIQDETAYLYFEAGDQNTSVYLATWKEAPPE